MTAGELLRKLWQFCLQYAVEWHLKKTASISRTRSEAQLCEHELSLHQITFSRWTDERQKDRRVLIKMI